MKTLKQNVDDKETNLDIPLTGTNHLFISEHQLWEIFPMVRWGGGCYYLVVQESERYKYISKKKNPVGRITSPSGRYSSALYVLCVLVVLSRPHAHHFDPLRPVHASTLVSVPNAPRACLPPF